VATAESGGSNGVTQARKSGNLSLDERGIEPRYAGGFAGAVDIFAGRLLHGIDLDEISAERTAY
jgi:hypothetical protein